MKGGLRGIQVQPVTRGPRREKRNRGQKRLGWRDATRAGVAQSLPGCIRLFLQEQDQNAPVRVVTACKPVAFIRSGEAQRPLRSARVSHAEEASRQVMLYE